MFLMESTNTINKLRDCEVKKLGLAVQFIDIVFSETKKVMQFHF